MVLFSGYKKTVLQRISIPHREKSRTFRSYECAANTNRSIRADFLLCSLAITLRASEPVSPLFALVCLCSRSLSLTAIAIKTGFHCRSNRRTAHTRAQIKPFICSSHVCSPFLTLRLVRHFPPLTIVLSQARLRGSIVVKAGWPDLWPHPF